MTVPPNVNIQIAGLQFEATQQVPFGNLTYTQDIIKDKVPTGPGIYVIGLEYAGEPDNFLPMYVGKTGYLQNRADCHLTENKSCFKGGQILLNYVQLTRFEVRAALFLYYLNWNALPNPSHCDKLNMLLPFFSYSRRLHKDVLLYFNDPGIYSHPLLYNIPKFPNKSNVTDLLSALDGVKKARKKLHALNESTFVGKIDAATTFIEANFRFAFIPENLLAESVGAEISRKANGTLSGYEKAIRDHLWANGEYVLGAR